MSRNRSSYILIGILFSTALFSYSCTDEELEDERMVVLRITSPKKDAQYQIGQSIALSVDIKEDYPKAQLQVFLNDSLIQEVKGVQKSMSFSFESSTWNLGFNDIKLILNGVEDKPITESKNVILFAKNAPNILLPEVVQTLNHKNDHYTQGLEFNNGSLYEGTGQYGESILAEINLTNGNPIRLLTLEKTFFGEGITILNDEIYQITWTNGTCFVYDLATFKLKRQMSYSGEGWGLANDGKHIIMSDGSSKIVFRDPKTFEIIRAIYAFSNTQEYRALNELEYVDGYIFANVYQQDYIAKINAKSGEVVALIDCEELKKIGRGNGDVLNGIAFNKKNGLFYLTGKNWDKIFAVQLVEKLLAQN